MRVRVFVFSILMLLVALLPCNCAESFKPVGALALIDAEPNQKKPSESQAHSPFCTHDGCCEVSSFVIEAPLLAIKMPKLAISQQVQLFHIVQSPKGIWHPPQA